MNNSFKNTTESPLMIVLGVMVLYLLIIGFIIYLFFLHRITLISTIISSILFTLIYLPRLFIIKKLANKDIIKIVDNGININNQLIPFSQITDFRVEEKKPAVIFIIYGGKTIYYNEAKFYLKLNNGQISFSAIGSEKIQLLKEFLSRLLNK